MDRRDVLKSVAIAAAGAGMAAAGASAVSASSAKFGGPAARVLRMPYLETADGTTLFYKDWGAGTPIIFVHSWSANSDMWQYQMTPLVAQGTRCIAYDRRGHGRSSQPGRGYDYDTLADDLAAVIEQLDVRNATLVGHSMGAGDIARYLSRHGASRVDRIVFLAPTLPFILQTPDNPAGVPKEFFDEVRAQWSKDFPKWLADNARPFFAPDTSAAMIEWAVAMSAQCPIKVAIDCNRAVTETDFRGELPKITVPTLIIQGDKDVSVPLDFTGRRTAELIPGSHLKVYEGAAHGLMFTHIDRLNGDLIEFVQG
ncbi:MAG TPA: alpha/beta hydrolase [Candidatus Binataceae bacterium]|nr:alpha/beta hydrolase [Candidatus Binataceae bacterium]